VNFVKNCALSIGLLAIAGGLTASRANAEALKGSFNLPFEAHWGRVVLQPGNYRMSLSTEGSGFQVIYLTGYGKTVTIPVGPYRTIPESGRTFLRVENVGGAYVIRELNSGAIGKQLIFLVPKSVNKQIAAARNAQDTNLPVSPAAGN
jgi:hypothetical protein